MKFRSQLSDLWTDATVVGREDRGSTKHVTVRAISVSRLSYLIYFLPEKTVRSTIIIQK